MIFSIIFGSKKKDAKKTHTDTTDPRSMDIICCFEQINKSVAQPRVDENLKWALNVLGRSPGASRREVDRAYYRALAENYPGNTQKIEGSKRVRAAYLIAKSMF